MKKIVIVEQNIIVPRMQNISMQKELVLLNINVSGQVAKIFTWK